MNVRHIIKKSLFAILGTVALSSCDMMTEDLNDCPTGLYVNFVYDYNIQKADMFKDHVGTVRLYVFDEDELLVLQREVSGSQLRTADYPIHFTEEELTPGRRYRLVAVGLQKQWDEALATPGAKYRLTAPTLGQSINRLYVDLDHSKGTRLYDQLDTVSSEAPLDTLWHTLTTGFTSERVSPRNLINYSWNKATKQPEASINYPDDDNIGDWITVNGQKDGKPAYEQGEPLYATVSMIRDTKHLHVNLRVVDPMPELREKISDSPVFDVKAEDYKLEIIDNNSQVNYKNDLTNTTDTLIYTPYAQWTTYLDGVHTEKADVPSEAVAEYDINFNRLLYKNTNYNADRYSFASDQIEGNRNALLLLRKAATDEILLALNLPYVLCSSRTSSEKEYFYQEYLDREYDYRLQIIMKGEEFYITLGTDVHILPWVVRTQTEDIQM